MVRIFIWLGNHEVSINPDVVGFFFSSTIRRKLNTYIYIFLIQQIYQYFCLFVHDFSKRRIFISHKWSDGQDEVKLYPSFNNNSIQINKQYNNCIFRKNNLKLFYTWVLSCFLPSGAAPCCESLLSSWPVPVWSARTQQSSEFLTYITCYSFK